MTTALKARRSELAGVTWDTTAATLDALTDQVEQLAREVLKRPGDRTEVIEAIRTIRDHLMDVGASVLAAKGADAAVTMRYRRQVMR